MMRSVIVAFLLFLVPAISFAEEPAKEVTDITIVYEFVDIREGRQEIPVVLDPAEAGSLKQVLDAATVSGEYNETQLMEKMMSGPNYKVFVRFDDNTEDIYNVFEKNFFHDGRQNVKLLSHDILPYVQDICRAKYPELPESVKP